MLQRFPFIFLLNYHFLSLVTNLSKSGKVTHLTINKNADIHFCFMNGFGKSMGNPFSKFSQIILDDELLNGLNSVFF